MFNGRIQEQFHEDHQRERFLRDTLRLFSGVETGHMNPHAFNEPDPSIGNDPVQGGKHWGNFILLSKDYKVIDNEIRIIDQYADQIGSALPVNAIYGELGPGEEKAIHRKTLRLLRSLKSPKKFISIDINGDFANNAAKIIENETGLRSEFIKGDFLAEELRSGTGQAIFSLFGGLLANGGKIEGVNSETQLTDTFNKLALNIMNLGDHLVITQDTQQDEQDLLKAYTHPDLAHYILSIMHKIKRDLPTRDFDPEVFEYVSRWLPRENLITLNAKVKSNEKGLPIHFQIAQMAFALRSGQELPLVNCYKYPVKEFVQAARNAGLSSQALYKSSNNPIALHIFRLDGPRDYEV